MITIHESPYDAPDAVALVEEMFADIEERYANDTDVSDEDDGGIALEVVPELVQRPLGIFLVAHVDGRPAGCGALKPLAGPPPAAAAPADRMAGEIKRMYTRPDARRLGVSRAVLGRLEEVALELGYTWLQLETGLRQPEAIALYESAGWERIQPYGRYRDDPLSVCFGKPVVPR